jgi:hypothetical protein
MKPVTRGLIVAILHVGLMASLGAKFLWERATLPRVWVRAIPYDPVLPIRGRYLRLQVLIDHKDVHFPSSKANENEIEVSPGGTPVTLSVQSDRLIATVVPEASTLRLDTRSDSTYALNQDVAFFIPEHIADPSRRPAGEQLWMESTIPKQGPPRPIRLGVRRGDGPIVPLPID